MTDETLQTSLAIEPSQVLTTLDIFGKPYQIRCQEDEIDELQQAAKHMNRALENLPHKKLIAPEKLALWVGLQIALELVKLEQRTQEKSDLTNERLQNLQNKLEFALNSDVELASAF